MSAQPQDNQESRRPHYPALDGLRAIAVLMVFSHHYAGSLLSGWGWTGVDLFFVLSGFLITGILYDSQNQPHRYRDFYMRRTLRIFPLYYALWLAILLVEPLAHWQWTSPHALWPAYLGNYARFLFLHTPGDPYRFDRLTFGATGFLAQHGFGPSMHLYIGHFWSLCLEEQFYLIWPLAVYTLRNRATLIRLCIAGIILVPILRWAIFAFAGPRMIQMEILYRSLPTRVDALLIGGLIALLLRGPEKAWLRRNRHLLLAVTAITLIAATLVHPGLQGAATESTGIYAFTLIDLFAAAIILEAIHPTGPFVRILSLKPLAQLGQISYGFYVYHDVFHDFFAYAAHHIFPTYPIPATIAIALLGNCAIASLSFRFFESPILTLKRHFPHQSHTTPVD